MILLLATCFALLLGLTVVMIYLLPSFGDFGKAVSIVLAIGIPFLVLFLNMKKSRRDGSAQLEADRVVFKLADQTRTILFSELKSYKIEHYNGTRLSLDFRDNTKFRLDANDNFGNSKAFEAFCHDLEDAINQYTLDTAAGLVRKPSLFEQKWLPVLLGIVTLALGWVVIQSILEGRKLPTGLFVSIVLFAPLWGAYFKARQKSKERLSQA